MKHSDLSALLLKHDVAIVELEKTSTKMMLIWRIVGISVLTTGGAFLAASTLLEFEQEQGA